MGVEPRKLIFVLFVIKSCKKRIADVVMIVLTQIGMAYGAGYLHFKLRNKVLF